MFSFFIMKNITDKNILKGILKDKTDKLFKYILLVMKNQKLCFANHLGNPISYDFYSSGSDE